ncbi:MAG: hypothetical protein AB1468_05165 [Candidatus Micrarchaeota archaeon]
MKILIAYYSLTGNTRNLARAMREHFLSKNKNSKISLEEIEPLEKYTYLSAYSRGCREVVRRILPEIKKPKHDPRKFDLLAVLSPTWAWNSAPPVNTYLSLLPRARKNQKAIAGFTHHSLARLISDTIANKLKAKGYDVLASVKIFIQWPIASKVSKEDVARAIGSAG